MSDFWAKKLGVGGGAPATTRTSPVNTGAAGPWWREPTVQTSGITAGGSPAGTYTAPADNLTYALQQEVDPRNTRAQSARKTDTCPSCYSSNYFQPQGNPNAMTRCYDCGYPIVQSSSGDTLPSSAAAGKGIRQAAQIDKGATFNGSVIAHL